MGKTRNTTKNGGLVVAATASSGEIKSSVAQGHRAINAACESLFLQLARKCGIWLTGLAIPFIVLYTLQRRPVKNMQTRATDPLAKSGERE
jgi:hypothetical protein